MMARLSALLLCAGLLPALAGAAGPGAPASGPAASEAKAAARSAEAAKAAIARLSLIDIRLANTQEAGISAPDAAAFQSELARKFGQAPSDDKSTKGTVEVRFDTLRVQGDVVRGKDGEPIPSKMFAATVRVLDADGQEISVYVIPETQLSADKLAIDRDKLFGVEGAAIVYRRLLDPF